SGLASAAGAANGRDQLTERQSLLHLIGFHHVRVNREGAGRYYGVNRGGFPPWEVVPEHGPGTDGPWLKLGAREKTAIPLVGLADGQPDIALDDALGDGVARETGDVMDVELAHEMLPMFVHRFEADAQFRGDLFVGPAFGNQLEHLHLARTEPVVFLFEAPSSILRLLIATVEALGNGRAEKLVSSLDLANRLGQNVCGGLLEQKSRGT